MPDLQSCYFCGTPEDVQEYAVIPPRFTPEGESPQSAVLCDQCKTKLLQVVQPLTEQLDEGAAGSDRPAAESATAGSTTPETAGNTDESAAPGEPGGSGITMSSAGDDAANEESAAPAHEPSPDTDAKPPNYRRAMRMLSNREFPLERSEVESMLAGAYDLERHEVDAVLEYAVDEGRLREEDGQFYQA